jgi:NAD(P)H-flavin reductase
VCCASGRPAVYHSCVASARDIDGSAGLPQPALVRGCVRRITALTAEATLLVIDVPPTFAFEAGQYVEFLISSGNARRAYSIMNLPGAERLEFLIKRHPDGRLPDLLRDLRPGTELILEGPYGRCVLNPRAAAGEYLLIAGGSGIAPMLSLLRGIVGSCRRTSAVVLFYGVGDGRDLLFLDTIKELGARVHRFDLVPVVSADGPPEARGARRGLVHHAVDDWLRTASVQAGAPRQVYMAGPPAMIEATYAVLTGTHGIRAGDVAFDAWSRGRGHTIPERAASGRLGLAERERIA